MTNPPLTRPGWPRPAASAAIFRDGQVLLVERGKGAIRGIWSFPGGHIEPGETAAAAAAREVHEETGIAARIAGLVDIHDVLLRDADGHLTAHYVLAVYWGHWSAGEPLAASDAASARFVALDDLAGYRLTPGVEALARRAHGLWLRRPET